MENTFVQADNIPENHFSIFRGAQNTYETKLNSVAFSPQAMYTDRATAACRRS
jgi:hypothetical protein